ncbi:MAG: hypothetical protein Q7S94_01995 [Gallionella sp.]|nr:hypothetical protein [Gallionella sp.]
MSKYQFAESDIYLTGTDIPKNRLGIEAPDLLHEVEATLLQQAYTRFITELEPSVRFDENYFKALHRDTYETLYEWAGLYRTVDMSKGGSLFCRAPYLEQEASRIFRILDVMDMQQELLARSMGEGHRIVRGVAGSGKTLILAFRAEQIARAASRPVLLLLSFANGISGRLENVMQDRGVEDKVVTSTFHAWCYKMLRTYGLPIPTEKEIPDFTERQAANVQAVLDAAESGLIPGGQYDAVLIGEAHDMCSRR